MRLIFNILAIILMGVPTLAQTDTVKKVRYSSDFRFDDGLFLNFVQVKNNQAIAASRIISNSDPYDIAFFKDLIEQKSISYFDQFGARKDVSTDNIWGFSQDGKLFINYNGEFNRIPIVGSICHFIADITVINSNYDPYHYDRYDYSYYNSYYSRPQNRSTRSKEMRQYVLNFVTGEVKVYNRESVMVLLMEDSELYDEYIDLRKRKQKDLMFFFIRRFNDKHPLFLPVW
ncbi:MAG: hypothetical protein HN352_00415 [Bacteroidetes bacterium]|jgi:hypothetical protein|nr:hypothetical protein [Bacteroidota bacterium]MBT4399426.1 hypothetical protein [Bacteroidota bacterium]MBT4410019.1 hypothetical protein [Bacteroidota bacterium]MBT5425783.1 hypothetical protein [Bacteroidota bacterium]MBT7095445.1 hypothetical protein [Bacteroidota bacterium]